MRLILICVLLIFDCTISKEKKKESLVTENEFEHCFLKAKPDEMYLARREIPSCEDREDGDEYGNCKRFGRENRFEIYAGSLYSYEENLLFKSFDRIVEVDGCPTNLIKDYNFLQSMLDNCYIPIFFLVLIKSPLELSGKIKKIKIERHRKKIVIIDLEEWLKKNPRQRTKNVNISATDLEFAKSSGQINRYSCK